MQKTSAKKIALIILRAALVIAPIAWIYARADAGAIAAALASVSAPAVACAAALVTFSMVLQGVKWWVLIRRFVPDLGAVKAVSAHLEGNFYSIALPSAIAQDVVKSVILSRSHSPRFIWASTWMAKLIGFFTLIFLSVAGAMYLENENFPAGFRPALIIAVAAITAMAAASFSKSLTRPLRAAAVKLAGPKITASAEKLRDGIYAFRHERATLAQTFLLSAAIQLLLVFNSSLVVYAVSGKFYFTECLAFVPLVEIMAISLPLTPGGVGIREALMALLFTRLGFSESQTAAYVTLSLMLSMTRLVGGIPVIWKYFKRPPQKP